MDKRLSDYIPKMYGRFCASHATSKAGLREVINQSVTEELARYDITKGYTHAYPNMHFTDLFGKAALTLQINLDGLAEAISYLAMQQRALEKEDANKSVLEERITRERENIQDCTKTLSSIISAPAINKEIVDYWKNNDPPWSEDIKFETDRLHMHLMGVALRTLVEKKLIDISFLGKNLSGPKK